MYAVQNDLRFKASESGRVTHGLSRPPFVWQRQRLLQRWLL